MYCFPQITRKVVRRVVIPHERKVGEMVMDYQEITVDTEGCVDC